MALPIEDYALIGDRRTAALVGTNGSVDWLCLPRFDSAACLAGLLGTDDHGHWQLVPDGDYSTERRYVGASAVLETTFTTRDGVVTLVDLMPRNDGRADLVRKLKGVRGTVRMRHEWRIRLDYGQVRPWVRRMTIDGEKVITAIGGPDQLVLRGPRLPVASRPLPQRRVRRLRGRRAGLLDDLVPVVRRADRPDDLARPDRGHHRRGREVGRAGCTSDVPHPDAVRRSLLTLRLMTDEVTGGIVAAPTTSLPEDFGGERNWDYRYCWLRDAALTLGSLARAGYTEEADLWRAWLLRTIAGDPARCRSSTPSTALAGCPRWPSTTCRATPTPGRCGSATAPSTRSSTTSSAR